jgi:fido (protein-threonine AMPylation protein)
MESKVIAIYCFVDDILQELKHPEDVRRRLNDAEVITTAIVSAMYFYGHQHRAISYMKSSKLIPQMLDKSRFTRRIHQIAHLLYELFGTIAKWIKEICCEMKYIIDSFPVAICDNMRIQRCKLALNKKNIEKAHKLLSKHIVAKHQQGKIRIHDMYITTPDGKIEYVAAIPQKVEAEMQKFYDDVDTLISAEMNIKEVFFYASLIHLVFVKIHPFNDGNGRTGRLLEKWFLAQKLGSKAWFVDSERYYYQQHQNYYNNLRVLGLEYHELDYTKALPFLLMLPNALNNK